MTVEEGWQAMSRTRVTLPAAVFVLGLLFASASVSVANPQSAGLSEPLLVAFIGDQGAAAGAEAVLNLIKEEGAHLVLHQGDFDYRDDPEAWDGLITRILGADFPYFASVGNHDVDRFYGADGYQAKLNDRLNKVAAAQCEGDLGVQSACRFRGLFFILSGVGTIPDRPDDPERVAFIRDQLAGDDSIWKICSWHKNQMDMQLGQKGDDVGWEPYEACRRGGAIIATGHEHTYARTHLMDDFESLSVASTASTLRLERGKSFAFVSGLGGESIRDQDRDGPWWAAVYTADQGANYGALFCLFLVDGDPYRARCYFKDIDGNVIDRFDIISDLKRVEP
jgi:hypothetical protein